MVTMTAKSTPVPAEAAAEDGGGGTVDALGCSKMDLLFVIDNSGSMGQEQTNLIANFPAFIAVLEASGLDYRVAVTTTARDYNYTMTVPIVGSIPRKHRAARAARC